MSNAIEKLKKELMKTIKNNLNEIIKEKEKELVIMKEDAKIRREK